MCMTRVDLVSPNVVAAFALGYACFDGSVGGIAGCLFALALDGNVCTGGRARGAGRPRAVTGIDMPRRAPLLRRSPATSAATPLGKLYRAGIWSCAPEQAGVETSVALKPSTSAWRGPARRRPQRHRENSRPRTSCRRANESGALRLGSDFVEDGLWPAPRIRSSPRRGLVYGIGLDARQDMRGDGERPDRQSRVVGSADRGEDVRIRRSPRVCVPLAVPRGFSGACITEQVAMFPGRRHARPYLLYAGSASVRCLPQARGLLDRAGGEALTSPRSATSSSWSRGTRRSTWARRAWPRSWWARR